MRNWANDTHKGKYGAYNDTNDPSMKKRTAHAKRYYATLQNSDKNDVINKISQNSKLRQKSIEKVYKHIFEDEHYFEDGQIKKFDPDYYMARSLANLYTGKGIQECDIIMLKHERLEYELMNRYKIKVYEIAHKLAEKKYNYSVAIKILREKE